jgi:hypothetical protein
VIFFLTRHDHASLCLVLVLSGLVDEMSSLSRRERRGRDRERRFRLFPRSSGGFSQRVRERLLQSRAHDALPLERTRRALQLFEQPVFPLNQHLAPLGGGRDKEHVRVRGILFGENGSSAVHGGDDDALCRELSRTLCSWTFVGSQKRRFSSHGAPHLFRFRCGDSSSFSFRLRDRLNRCGRGGHLRLAFHAVRLDSGVDLAAHVRAVPQGQFRKKFRKSSRNFALVSLVFLLLRIT